MRKTLLTLACVGILSAGSAFAVAPAFGKTPKTSPERVLNAKGGMANKKVAAHKKIQNLATRATSDLWMNWGYCDEPYNAFEMEYTGTLKQAIMVTEDIATKWAGAEISAVLVANPTNLEYINPLEGNEVKVWISESLDDSNPICYGTGAFGTEGFDYTAVELDKPYTLVADTPIYIGCTFENPDPSDYENGLFTLVTDYGYPLTDYTAYVYSKLKGFDDEGYMEFGDTYEWKELGEEVGNVCIKAHISGDMLPQNQVTIDEYMIPSVVRPDQEFDFVFISHNDGANSVSNLDLTFSAEGQEPQVKRIELDYAPIEYNQFSLDTIRFSMKNVGNNIPYDIQITSINGTAIEDGAKVGGYMVCLENGFDRNVVVEEATGTWCGWCVIGYAGMEYMKENYADKGFIGIAMHEGDPMSVLDEGEAYYQFSDYISGFPSAFMDRNWSYQIDPSPEELEYEFLNMVAYPTLAKIDAELVAEKDSKNVTVNVVSQYALSDEKSNYGIAYAVVEDNVGPYIQVNYTSGLDEDYYGFENYGSQVPLIYSDVARNCSHPGPLEDSILEGVVAYTPYEFSFEVELTDVTNLDNYRIIAMVIDGVTGSIVNACEVSPKNPSGIKSISSGSKSFRVIGGKGVMSISNEVMADVITTDGRIVAKGVSGNIHLPAGMYLVNSGNKTQKVVVR